jgi:hypothetical protein
MAVMVAEVPVWAGKDFANRLLPGGIPALDGSVQPPTGKRKKRGKLLQNLRLALAVAV